MISQKKEQKQDYELVFQMTGMNDFRQSLYDYKQDNPNNYYSVFFKSSMKHFPKYYFFYEIQEFIDNRIKKNQLVLLKQKQLPQKIYTDYVKKNYHQKFDTKRQRIKCKPLIALELNKKKGSNTVYIKILPNYFQKNYEQTFGRQAPIPYHVVRFYKNGYNLSEKQQLKVGKMSYIITGIRLSHTDINDSIKRKKITHISDCQNIKKVKRWASQIDKNSQTTSQSGNQKEGSCKICLENDQNDQQQILITPCSCVQPVHINCLQHWMKVKLQARQNQEDMDARINHVNYSKLFCQICKVPLPRIFIIEQYIYEMVYFQDNLEVPYLSISKIQKNKSIEQTNQEFAIQKLSQPATIGRYEQNGVQINDPSISRKHSELVYQKQKHKMTVRDLRSKFGTLVRVNNYNNTVEVTPQQRRGFQIQSYLLVAELVSLKSSKK